MCPWGSLHAGALRSSSGVSPTSPCLFLAAATYILYLLIFVVLSLSLSLSLELMMLFCVSIAVAVVVAVARNVRRALETNYFGR